MSIEYLAIKDVAPGSTIALYPRPQVYTVVQMAQEGQTGEGSPFRVWLHDGIRQLEPASPDPNKPVRVVSRPNYVLPDVWEAVQFVGDAEVLPDVTMAILDGVRANSLVRVTVERQKR